MSRGDIAGRSSVLQCYCGNKPAMRGWSALLKLRKPGPVSTRGRRRRCRVLSPLNTGPPFLIHAGLSSDSCEGVEILVRMPAAWGARVPPSPPGARYGLTDTAGRAVNLPLGCDVPPIRTADRASCEGIISWGRRRRWAAVDEDLQGSNPFSKCRKTFPYKSNRSVAGRTGWSSQARSAGIKGWCTWFEAGPVGRRRRWTRRKRLPMVRPE